MKIVDRNEKVEIILTYAESEVLAFALSSFGDLKNYIPKKELGEHKKHFNLSDKLSDKLFEYINS